MMSDCVTPTDLNSAKSLISSLENVQTLRALYTLPFPLALHSFPADDALNNFGETKRDNKTSEGIETPDGHMAWRYDHIPAKIHPALNLIRAFDRASAPFEAAKRWDFDIRGPGYCSSNEIVRRPHVDGAMVPCMRVYFYASHDGSFVVPHEKHLEILQRRHADLLDMPFNDRDFYHSFAAAQGDLANYFYLAAERVPAKTLTVLTGATLHFQPYKIDDNRRFLRAGDFGCPMPSPVTV